ncbi:MAG: FMN-binding protein [Candidatus Izemoplasmataceae bacterium]
MKRIVISLSIFFLIMLVFIIPFSVFLLRGMNEVLSEEITSIDITSLEDGVYLGSYTKYRWQNTIEVTILDGQITKITIIDDMRMPNEQVQTILFERIIADNSIDVDVVASATVSSKAYLKAIEDALKD